MLEVSNKDNVEVLIETFGKPLPSKYDVNSMVTGKHTGKWSESSWENFDDESQKKLLRNNEKLSFEFQQCNVKLLDLKLMKN